MKGDNKRYEGTKQERARVECSSEFPPFDHLDPLYR
jgi:hypothetical protein